MRYRQIKSHKAGLSSRPLNKYIQQDVARYTGKGNAVSDQAGLALGSRSSASCVDLSILDKGIAIASSDHEQVLSCVSKTAECYGTVWFERVRSVNGAERARARRRPPVLRKEAWGDWQGARVVLLIWISKNLMCSKASFSLPSAAWRLKAR